jgi:hypothetical protein
MRYSKLLPLFAGVTLIIGCGDDKPSGPETTSRPAAKAPSDEEIIKATVIKLNTALADGDGKTACSLLAPEVADAMKIAAPTFDAPPESCEEAVPRLNEADDADPELARAIKFADVKNIQVRGDEAVADVTSADLEEPQRATLTKESGEWLVVEIPGYGDIRDL